MSHVISKAASCTSATRSLTQGWGQESETKQLHQWCWEFVRHLERFGSGGRTCKELFSVCFRTYALLLSIKQLSPGSPVCGQPGAKEMQITLSVHCMSFLPKESLACSRDGVYTCPCQLQELHNVRSKIIHEQMVYRQLFLERNED